MKRRIVILGGGESGVGAAILALKKGFDVFLSSLGEVASNYVKVLDDYAIAYESGKHTEALILNADEVIKSPGIPDSAPIVKKLKDREIPIISEIEFAGRYCSAKKICITGSNGKTTTSVLCYVLLKDAGLNVGLAGNVGKSYAWQVATKQYDYYVLELSSFQLDGMFSFKADIAILLNITPDHLDRYDYKFGNYVSSKFRIVQNQTEEDYFIFYNNDPVIQQEMQRANIKSKKLPFGEQVIAGDGGMLIGNEVILRLNQNQFNMSIFEIELQGKHNVGNSMAASLAAKVLNIKNEYIRKCLSSFEGVEHRLEKLGAINGVEYINDSKATNVNSTWYALESMKKPVIWIVGGVDKGNDYSELDMLVKQKVKAIVCLGIDNKKIAKHFEGFDCEIIDANSMSKAVQASNYFAEKGDVVLLSPACASFDLFDSYEDRGRQFKREVRNI